jgi:hypothetical protein
MCVQRFDDSRRSAIRITYRISLRSSSLWEPRHPLLKVVWHLRHMRRGKHQKILPTPSFLKVNVISFVFGIVVELHNFYIAQQKYILKYVFTVIDLGDLGKHVYILVLVKQPKRQTILYLVVMILPQVHLRKPCYDFTFL